MSVFSKTAILALFSLFFALPANAQETGGAKGRVRTPSGDALAGVKVTARQNGSDVKTAVTNAKGAFVIDGLKKGKYDFSFLKDGYASGNLYNVEIGKNKIRDIGKNLYLEIDEGTLVIIKGSVFDANGHSFYGAKVEIFRVSSGGGLKKLGEREASQSGEFTFRFPEETATYRIVASAKGMTDSKEVSVNDAAIYRLALTLKK